MHRPSTLVPSVVFLVALLSMSSCKTVAELGVAGLAKAVTGQDVDVDDLGDGRGFDAAVRELRDDREDGATEATAVYQAGPTPGWERGFRSRASVGSAYFQNSVCLNIPLQMDISRLWSREPSDPFGPVDRPGYEVFVKDNTQGVPPGYTRLGEVRLGGASPTGEIWQSLDMAGMYGSNGGSCPLFGIFALGRIGDAGTILR